MLASMNVGNAVNPDTKSYEYPYQIKVRYARDYSTMTLKFKYFDALDTPVSSLIADHKLYYHIFRQVNRKTVGMLLDLIRTYNRHEKVHETDGWIEFWYPHNPYHFFKSLIDLIEV